jgi:hypothetical protein
MAGVIELGPKGTPAGVGDRRGARPLVFECVPPAKRVKPMLVGAARRTGRGMGRAGWRETLAALAPCSPGPGARASTDAVLEIHRGVSTRLEGISLPVIGELGASPFNRALAQVRLGRSLHARGRGQRSCCPREQVCTLEVGVIEVPAHRPAQAGIAHGRVAAESREGRARLRHIAYGHLGHAKRNGARDGLAGRPDVLPPEPALGPRAGGPGAGVRVDRRWGAARTVRGPR